MNKEQVFVLLARNKDGKPSYSLGTHVFFTELVVRSFRFTYQTWVKDRYKNPPEHVLSAMVDDDTATEVYYRDKNGEEVYSVLPGYLASTHLQAVIQCLKDNGALHVLPLDTVPTLVSRGQIQTEWHEVLKQALREAQQ